MSAWGARVGGVAGAVMMWFMFGGWAGIGAGVIGGCLLARTLRRIESDSQRKERARLAADVPFAADLLAAAVRAGSPTEHGLRIVGTGLGGSFGRQLVRVADGLRLGLEPADAWKALTAVPETARIAGAIARSADSGAAVARALERLADALRAEAAARVEASAQRLSVLLVLPLGLCFLPAFVFAGIAPVIVAVLGGVLR